MAGSRSSTRGRAVQSEEAGLGTAETWVTTTAAFILESAFAAFGVWRSPTDRHRMGALARRPALVAVCALLVLCPAPAEGSCRSPARNDDLTPRWAPLVSSRAHHD
jgi:hypothetical protein